MTGPGGKQPSEDLIQDQPVGEDARRSLEARISAMTVPEKVELASKGNREVRRILSKDASSMVARAVISSPRLSGRTSSLRLVLPDERGDPALHRGQPAVDLEPADRVGDRAEPEDPPPAAIRFLSMFANNELRVLMNNRGVSVVVRQEAKRLLARRT